MDGDLGLFVYLAPMGALLILVAAFLIADSAMASTPLKQDRKLDGDNGTERNRTLHCLLRR